VMSPSSRSDGSHVEGAQSSSLRCSNNLASIVFWTVVDPDNFTTGSRCAKTLRSAPSII
jgi:hypothetical protein